METIKKKILFLFIFFFALFFSFSAILLSVTRPDLSFISDTLSKYAVGKNGFILETGFLCIGLAEILISFVLKKTRKNKGALFLFLAGLGMFLVTSFPMDTDKINGIYNFFHIFGASIQFLCFPLALIFLKNDDVFKNNFSFKIGISTLILFLIISIVYSFNFSLKYFGLIEKMDIFLINLWLLLFPLKIFKLNAN